jgi:hypothetical protein
LRYFSIEEAEALLPKIRTIFDSANETKRLIEEKVDGWRKVHKKLNEAEEAVMRGQVDYLAARLEEQLGEIAEMGGVPKDLDEGLVDFPARINGKEGYLCWKLGEKKISHWHSLTEGFSGRKKLKRG